MIDAIFSLRFLLLIAGGFIVAAIYLFGSRKSKRNKRVKFETNRSTFRPRNRNASHAGTEEPRDPIFAHSGGQGADEVVEDVIIKTGEPALELPTITRSGDAEAPARARGRANQMELTFEEDSPAPDPRTDSDDGVEDTIIALYVRPPTDREFAGRAIVAAMNAVGLRHGDMEIFHHFGAGELTTDSPLFSVANMVEPGNFKLDKIDSFSTPGLAMFLRLPGPLDGAVAFELFLNTAQRLAEALSGDLYSAPQALLDGITIDKMRHLATPYSNVR